MSIIESSKALQNETNTAIFEDRLNISNTKDKRGGSLWTVVYLVLIAFGMVGAIFAFHFCVELCSKKKRTRLVEYEESVELPNADTEQTTEAMDQSGATSSE